MLSYTMNMKKLTPAFIILAVVVLGLLYLNSNRAKNLENVPQASVVLNQKDTQSSKSGTQTSSDTKTTSTVGGETDNFVVVNYTSKGFAPFITEIHLGDTVKFINSRSDRALWVVSVHSEGTQEYYPGFSGSKSLDKGESFILPFTKAGAWSYKNLNDASHQGVILVR